MGYRIDTRHARQQLKSRTSPYWKTIDSGFSIGYRKNKSTGTWFVRRHLNGGYTIRRIGAADDNQDHNGINVLSYTQARQKATNYEDVIEELQIPQHPALFTVNDAISEYLGWYETNRKAYASTKKTCDALIVPALGNLPVVRLTKTHMDKWLQDLSTSPPKTKNGYPKPPYAIKEDTGRRSKRKGLVIYQFTGKPYAEWTEEMKRKRKSTANRVLTILKAALNHAWSNEKVAVAGAWQRVKPFKNVDAPKVAHLSEKQARQLLEAARDDFRPMAHAALLTGCRYGELSRLKVSDLDRGQLYIEKTKTGKSRHVPLSDEGLKLFKSLAAGKKRNDLLLTHQDGRAWDPDHQARPMREACKAAGIDPPVGFHILRHTYATLLLRSGESHGVSIRYVSELIGDSVATCQKHYGHVIQDDLRAEVARKLPSFGGAL